MRDRETVSADSKQEVISSDNGSTTVKREWKTKTRQAFLEFILGQPLADKRLHQMCATNYKLAFSLQLLMKAKTISIS